MRFSAVVFALLFGAFACGDSDEEMDNFVYCMDIVQYDEFATPDCRHRIRTICRDISRKGSLVWRARLAVSTVKGIARDFARLAGVQFGVLEESHAECVVSYEDICKDFGVLWPCDYESCLAEIPQNCAERTGE
jgi:hypothetical protein